MVEKYTDVSELLKSGITFQDLYKLKRNNFGKNCLPEAAAQRAENLNKHRRKARDDLMYKKRNIVESDLTLETTLPKMPKTQSQKAMEDRLEKLKQWKATKNQLKAKEKLQQKPVFKVFHVSQESLPDIENANKTIKGKPISSNAKVTSTASTRTHKYGTRSNSTVLPASSSSFAPITRKRIASASETKTNKTHNKPLPIKKSELKEKPTDTIKPSQKPPAKRTTAKNDKQKVTKTENVASKVKTKKEKTPVKTSTNKQLIKERTPAKINTDIKDTEDETPKKDSASSQSSKTSTPVVYVSPFVTISRGKYSARKEYHNRLNGSIEELTELKSDTPQSTSNKAAASYFYGILDREIERIQSLCEKWNMYKEETDHPEEVCNMINVAVGQSQLLINKKFEQFRSLIDRCANKSDGNPVTCEDLHGFWDMVYIQVNNLSKRFENLDTLKSNDWEEIIPEKKIVKKVQPVKKVNVKASSKLKDAIKAARKLKASQQSNPLEVNTFDGGFFNINSPRKSSLVRQKTPRKSRGSLLPAFDASKKNTAISSPGLSVLRVSQLEKSLLLNEEKTPAKSILKQNCCHSTQKKNVLFKQIAFDESDTENDMNIVNEEKIEITPRRSTRLRSKIH